MDSDDKKKYSAHRWVGCPLEEEYFGQERKAGKQERKIATAKDRSKYKKTDKDKILNAEKKSEGSKFQEEGYFRGRVLATTSEGFVVEHEGNTYSCTLRGALKKQKGQAKNLVVVGDNVFFEILDPQTGMIAHVETRKSVLSRADNLSRRKEQLIAANIDQLIITGSVVAPRLKAPLLDRYVIAARKGDLKPLIVINKVDLLEDSAWDSAMRQEEKELCEHLLKAYEAAGLRAIAVSLASGEGIESLKKEMQGKASVFSGQSGVGKSSLINAITGASQKTGDIVEKTQKGSHTTTSTKLLPLELGGWCIDTPGIKSFGVWDLREEEVEKYFSEIHAIGRSCHFPNCKHLHENNCAVIEALEKEEISLIRYYSYQTLLNSVSQAHIRR